MHDRCEHRSGHLLPSSGVRAESRTPTITDRFEPICMVMTTDGPVSFVVTLSPLTEVVHDPRRDELQNVDIMHVEHLKIRSAVARGLLEGVADRPR